MIPAERRTEATPADLDDVEGYDGPATVLPASDASTETSSGGVEPIPVQVHLRGHFEPIDGRFHWAGRIQPEPRLDERHRSGDVVVLRTPQGSAKGRLSDVDPWGRFRIAGLGAPPFTV